MGTIESGDQLDQRIHIALANLRNQRTEPYDLGEVKHAMCVLAELVVEGLHQLGLTEEPLNPMTEEQRAKIEQVYYTLSASGYADPVIAHLNRRLQESTLKPKYRQGVITEREAALVEEFYAAYCTKSAPTI